MNRKSTAIAFRYLILAVAAVPATFWSQQAAASPDLLSTSLTASPASLFPGDSAIIKFQVQNAGDEPSGNFRVAAYYSHDITISSEDTLLSMTDINSLAAGAVSVTFSADVQIPASASPGSRYLGIMVDFQNHVAESDEFNNTRRTNISVVNTRPDFEVTAIEANPTSILQTGRLTVSCRIANSGNRDAGLFRTRLYLSDDAAITTSDTYLGIEYEQALDAGASTETLVSEVTVPPATPPGTRYIGAIANWDNSLQELNSDNNTRAVSVSILALNCHGKSVSAADVCGGHGICVNTDVCECQNGWSGFDCSTPQCTPPCGENASCVAPDTCECDVGFTGDGYNCSAIEDVLVTDNPGSDEGEPEDTTPADEGSQEDLAAPDSGQDTSDQGTPGEDLVNPDSITVPDDQGRTDIPPDTPANADISSDTTNGGDTDDNNSGGGGCSQSDASPGCLPLLLLAGCIITVLRRMREDKRTA